MLLGFIAGVIYAVIGYLIALYFSKNAAGNRVTPDSVPSIICILVWPAVVVLALIFKKC